MLAPHQLRKLLCLFLLLGAGKANLQEPTIGQLQQSVAIGNHGSHPGLPFGEPDPKQPAVQQFDFLIGHFERLERRLDPATGRWSPWGRGEKNGSWIMDGAAILDEHINYDSGERILFVRAYEASTAHWHNVRVSLPDFLLTDAEGEFRGSEYHNDSRFVDAQGREVFQEYIFYDITPSGYKWRAQRTIAEQTLVYWEIHYKKLAD